MGDPDGRIAHIDGRQGQSVDGESEAFGDSNPPRADFDYGWVAFGKPPRREGPEGFGEETRLPKYTPTNVAAGE